MAYKFGNYRLGAWLTLLSLNLPMVTASSTVDIILYLMHLAWRFLI
jgi:hypothetical protein